VTQDKLGEIRAKTAERPPDRFANFLGSGYSCQMRASVPAKRRRQRTLPRGSPRPRRKGGRSSWEYATFGGSTATCRRARITHRVPSSEPEQRGDSWRALQDPGPHLRG
jgi:hypothetical protein